MPEEKLEKEIEKVENDIDVLSKITFLGDLLDKQNVIRNVLDVRTNIVIGINSALIVFFVTSFSDKILNSPFLVGILGVLALSLIFAIIALKPPAFSTKKGQAESLFYHHYIDSKNMEDYRKDIHETLDNEKQIYDAYITEAYNLSKYSNVPRKYYINLSIHVLIYGMALVSFVYLLTSLLGRLIVGY